MRTMEMPESKGSMLNNIKAFVLDMDGTIYLGNDLFHLPKTFS